MPGCMKRLPLDFGIDFARNNHNLGRSQPWSKPKVKVQRELSGHGKSVRLIEIRFHKIDHGIQWNIFGVIVREKIADPM